MYLFVKTTPYSAALASRPLFSSLRLLSFISAPSFFGRLKTHSQFPNSQLPEREKRNELIKPLTEWHSWHYINPQFKFRMLNFQNLHSSIFFNTQSPTHRQKFSLRQSQKLTISGIHPPLQVKFLTFTSLDHRNTVEEHTHSLAHAH